MSAESGAVTFPLFTSDDLGSVLKVLCGFSAAQRGVVGVDDLAVERILADSAELTAAFQLASELRLSFEFAGWGRAARMVALLTPFGTE